VSNVSTIPSQSVPAATPEPTIPNRAGKIGEMLVERGVMTPDQVDRVLDIQRTAGGRFGEIAVKLRFATSEHVQEALARQFGYATTLQVQNSRLSPEFIEAFNPVSPFAEAIRTLRSQLMLRWFDGTPSQACLAVTSVDRGDGKSFIVANLGASFSQLGERTLIIDADMRNATQHQIFGLANRLGLSGILSGRAGYDEITPIQGLPNLSVLSSGPLPPNPQELLGRPEFGQFLNELTSRYDVILIDTPSAQQASDAQVVAQRARAAVIVGRKGITRSKDIAQLASILGNSGIAILGATFNEY
jgi:receptor protein-tyrosine kinase